MEVPKEIGESPLAIRNNQMFMSRHEHDSMHLNGVTLGVNREAIEVKLDELGVRPEQKCSS
jgi:hypothetical protein